MLKLSSEAENDELEAFASWLRGLLGELKFPDLNHEEIDSRAPSSPDLPHSHQPDHTCAEWPNSSKTPLHCYEISRDRAWNRWGKRCPAAHQRQIWFCHSIVNGGEHYSWRSSAQTFNQYAGVLQKAMNQGDQRATHVACIQILGWGGTPMSKNMKNWFIKQVNNNSLIKSIDDAANLLRGSATAPLSPFGKSGGLLMNSGMAKIYAAAALDLKTRGNDVLIYDGRVGAALCYLVKRYCQISGLTKIPDALQFRWGAGKSASEKTAISQPGKMDRRNPSNDTYHFAQIGSNALVHATLARRGAKLLQILLSTTRPSCMFSIVEQGLFMIGYDVRYLCCPCPCNR